MSAAGHHAAAADHNDQAAAIMRRQPGISKNMKKNSPFMRRKCHRHAHHSVFHGDEAAMHHVEHYGKSHRLPKSLKDSPPGRHSTNVEFRPGRLSSFRVYRRLIADA